MNRIRGIGALAAVLLSICACSSSPQNAGSLVPMVAGGSSYYGARPNDVVGGGHKNRLSIMLGDVALPNGINLTQVNLGIDKIYVTDPHGNQVIVAQYASPHVVNVLAYQNGTTTQIASASVPTVTYSSMTIVVDTATSSVLTASGTKTRLVFKNVADASSAGFGKTTTTATASSTVALTFRGGFTVTETGQVNFDTDFNAFESLIPTTNSSSAQWSSRASLSVAQQGFEGTISGEVLNASRKAVHNAVVVATNASGIVVGSTFTDSSGAFLLHTLAAGSYKLTVYNSYTTASGWHIAASGNTKTVSSFAGPASVRVLSGQKAFVGTIAD